MSAAWAAPAVLAWLAVLLVPWRPWSTRERLDVAGSAPEGPELDDVAAIVPARDEAENLARTLPALLAQGARLRVVVVDDESRDRTARVAAAHARVEVVSGAPLPDGWTGKVWAQAQGLERVERPLTLLLDADVVLAPGVVAALRERLRERGGGLVSLMVELPTQGGWERLLVPPFVWFFKLLYPFSLAARPRSRVAAAAGGCVLVETEALRAIGGFAALRGALIDDCTLARLVKRAGYPVWIGLTRSARSVRRYRSLGEFWNMVARTAFTQLGCSAAALAACTVLMAAAFVIPVVAVVAGTSPARVAGVAGLLAMAGAYAPTLRYYALPVTDAFALPVAACLYLAMTWSSALRYWRGERSSWRGRRYST